MGVNYYARIIPSENRKKELKDLIESNDFDSIKEEINKTYGRFYTYEDDVVITGEIHLGKRSAGWKFLWNPNIYIIRHGHLEWSNNDDGSRSGHFVPEPNTAFYLYPLTKVGIKAFIDREDVEIFDECGRLQDKETFFEDALNNIWHGKEGYDAKTYEESDKAHQHLFKNTGEYIDMLISEGFKMNSISNSDFYSDGLRFATTTEFS